MGLIVLRKARVASPRCSAGELSSEPGAGPARPRVKSWGFSAMALLLISSGASAVGNEVGEVRRGSERLFVDGGELKKENNVVRKDAETAW